MSRTLHAVAVLVLISAACSEPPPAPRPQAKAQPDPALQPKLEPRPQVIIPTPPAPAVLETKPQRSPAEENRLLAERVRRALEEESRIHAAAIDVTAAGGTVTLWGTATSDDERARATRVAARIAGVKWVNNKLAIAAGS